MNLLIRLFATIVAGIFWIPRVGPLDNCVTPFRVAPTDLDVIGHMNNGVYLSLLDVARVDYLVRCGVFWKGIKKRWYPVVAGQSIEYRRSLPVLRGFQIESRVAGWDDRAFFIEQIFRSRGEVHAVARVRGQLVKRTGGSVAISEMLALFELDPTKNPLTDEILRWIAAQRELRAK